MLAAVLYSEAAQAVNNTSKTHQRPPKSTGTNAAGKRFVLEGLTAKPSSGWAPLNSRRRL
jgi:hypothetical protein